MRIIIESDHDEDGATRTAEVPVLGAAATGIDAGPPPTDLLTAVEMASPTDTGGEVTDAGPPSDE